MKNINLFKNYRVFANAIVLFISTAMVFTSCDFEYELPEAGSIPDKTPPTANFTATQNTGPGDTWKRYNFANLSTNATTYLWNFGDGTTATTLDAAHIFEGEGTYMVTLQASDNLGVISTISKNVVVTQPPTPTVIVPVIGEAGFETGDTSCGTAADGRDCWRISGGTIFGITTSPVRSGSQGAKFDANQNRVAYQALTVSPNTNYTVTIFYTIKTTPLGSAMRLAILGNEITNASQAPAAIIASATGSDQSNANTYVPLSVTFNSGASNKIAIWIDSNGVSESRVDDVSIVAN